MTVFRFAALVLVLAGCAGEALSGDEPQSEVADLLPAPGCYLLTSPLVSSTGRGCSAVATTRVVVAADGSAAVNVCPRGWSCWSDATAELGELYSAVLPKSGGVVCDYDVTAGSFADPPAELPDHGGCP